MTESGPASDLAIVCHTNAADMTRKKLVLPLLKFVEKKFMLNYPSRCSYILCLLMLVTSFWTISGQRAPGQRQKALARNQRVLSPRQIADKVLRSVVLIVTQDKEGKPIAQGSGFFFEKTRPEKTDFDFDDFSTDLVGTDEAKRALKNEKLWVATNLHVMKRAWQASVKDLRSGTTYKVRSIIGFDVKHDLCVLRLEGNPSSVPLTVAPSNGLEIGDDIYAAGNPEGLEGSFSKGVVSAVRRDRDLIQIDAAISPGSSGGPVVDSRGDVVGIAVGMKLGGQNLNFAIPGEFLSNISLKWSLSAGDAGALAITSKERDRLQGPVRKIVTSEAEYRWDETTKSSILGQAKTKEAKIYNFNGDAAEFMLYWVHGVALHSIYSYGDLGCINSTVTTDKDGKQTVNNMSDRDCVYGRIRANSPSDKMTFTAPDNSKHTVKFDQHGNEIEYLVESVDGTGSSEVTTSTYDSHGMLVEQFYKQSGGYQELRRFKYDVDSYGNWTKRLETHSFPNLAPSRSSISSPSKVTLREITYFER